MNSHRPFILFPFQDSICSTRTNTSTCYPSFLQSRTCHVVLKEDEFIMQTSKTLYMVLVVGKKTTPKHIVLGCTLHQTTRSKQLIKLFQRAGHVLSYEQILQIDTGPYHSLTECDTASYFFGKSNQATWCKFQQHYNLLATLHDTEKFVCRMYNFDQVDTTDDVRIALFFKASKPELRPQQVMHYASI